MNKQHIIIGLVVIVGAGFVLMFSADHAVAPVLAPSTPTPEAAVETGSTTDQETPSEVVPDTSVIVPPVQSVRIENPALPSKPEPIPSGGCIVGGCSSQLCVDAVHGDVASTCEWFEEYACYKSATCERQVNGLCGWTVTPELERCIANARVNLLNPVAL